MKKVLAGIMLTLSFSAFAANLVDSYLDGNRKVCVYDDGSEVSVGVNQQCPYFKH